MGMPGDALLGRGMVRLRAGGVLILGLSLSAFAESGFLPVGDLPSEFHQARSSLNHSAVASETFRFNEPILWMESGGVQVSVPGTQALEVETLPALPYLEKIYDLPQGTSAEVSWEIPSAFKSNGPIPLKALPETGYWTTDPAFQLAPPGKGNWVPGKPVTVETIGGQARVRIFPVQWNRSTQQLVRIAQINVQIDSKRLPEGAGVAPPSVAESVIVAPLAFKAGALLLQNSHLRLSGLRSEIAWVEDIEKTEPEIEEADLPAGYKNRAEGDLVVQPYDPVTGKGYHYSRARKIAHFLQARLTEGGSLRYVTLLGDGSRIPPSYYFSVRTGFATQFGVTDQCYASVKQCEEARAVVGRLPFDSLAQVENHIAKVERWIATSAGTSSELALYGGKGLSGPFYIGELGLLRTLSSTADWFGVRKNFRTRGNYTPGAVNEMIRGNRPSPIVYSVDHGMGNRWLVEKDGIASKEIAAIGSSGSQTNPLVFAIACMNGAFDEALTQEEVFADSRFGRRSIGVELLRSPAGAVSYFGSSRNAVGAPIFDIDPAGNLDLRGSNHGLKILDTALEQYRGAGKGRLGDFVLSSFTKYLRGPEAGLARDRVLWTYFNSVLLGDPTLPMPIRSRREWARPLALALDEIETAFSGFFPRLVLPDNGFVPLRFDAAVEGAATLFRQSSNSGLISETVVQANAYPPGLSELAFTDTQGRQTYFLRLENTSGVPTERQIWFRTQ